MGGGYRIKQFVLGKIEGQNQILKSARLESLLSVRSMIFLDVFLVDDFDFVFADEYYAQD